MKKRIGVVVMVVILIFVIGTIIAAVMYNQRVRQINQNAQDYIDELIEDEDDPYIEIPDQTGLLENTAEVFEDDIATLDTADFNVAVEAIEQRYGLTLIELGEIKDYPDFNISSCIAYFSEGYEFIIQYNTDTGVMMYRWENYEKFIR